MHLKTHPRWTFFAYTWIAMMTKALIQVDKTYDGNCNLSRWLKLNSRSSLSIWHSRGKHIERSESRQIWLLLQVSRIWTLPIWFQLTHDLTRALESVRETVLEMFPINLLSILSWPVVYRTGPVSIHHFLRWQWQLSSSEIVLFTVKIRQISFAPLWDVDISISIYKECGAVTRCIWRIGKGSPKPLYISCFKIDFNLLNISSKIHLY